MEPRLQTIFDSMGAGGQPGWWRAAADIDGYSTQAQQRLAANIKATLGAREALINGRARRGVLWRGVPCGIDWLWLWLGKMLS